MSKVYEADIIDDLQGNLEVANSTIHEWETKTQEFKDFVKELPIEVYDYKIFQSRVDAIFREVFKELNNAN